MVGKRAPTAERFLSKFEQGNPDECWNWQANQNGAGYGLIWSPERGRKVLAHRYAYEHFNGTCLRAHDVVMHACDNPSCVNPNHLSVGTLKMNSVDSARKGRVGNMILGDLLVVSLLRDYINGMSHAALAKRYSISVKSVPDFTTGRSRAWLHGKNGCPTLAELKAARNITPNAKVTAETAAEIRRRLADGEMGKDLATEYGLHKATVSDIKLRKIWADD